MSSGDYHPETDAMQASLSPSAPWPLGPLGPRFCSPALPGARTFRPTGSVRRAFPAQPGILSERAAAGADCPPGGACGTARPVNGRRRAPLLDPQSSILDPVQPQRSRPGHRNCLRPAGLCNLWHRLSAGGFSGAWHRLLARGASLIQRIRPHVPTCPRPNAGPAASGSCKRQPQGSVTKQRGPTDGPRSRKDATLNGQPLGCPPGSAVGLDTIDSSTRAAARAFQSEADFLQAVGECSAGDLLGVDPADPTGVRPFAKRPVEDIPLVLLGSVGVYRFGLWPEDLAHGSRPTA